MKLAIEAWDACGRYPDATSDIERLDVAINALRSALAQQPARGEPVAWLDEMLADTREVFDANGSETPQVVRDVIEYVASWVTVHSEKNHPAPSVLKDDQIAALVNKVRDIARMFNDHQSLRERIAIELVPALKVSQEAKSDAERGRFLIEWLKRYGLLQAEFGQMGVGEKPENWWLLHAPWGIDKTRPFFGHGKTPEQAIDAAMLAAKTGGAA